MNNTLYDMLFKRKSYHTFKNHKTKEFYSTHYRISEEEYEEIRKVFKTFDSLYPDIKVDIRIAENEETTCTRGQEKVILLYSEIKENYLMNVGYLGEQLDLYLASMNIGCLWFGLNKAKMPDYHGLQYVIMIAISKVPEDSFRKDMFKSKRKEEKDIWSGEPIEDIPTIIRFAPSACNTQPWFVKHEEDTLKIYRYVSPIRKWVMPIDGVLHYNHIDIGIFLCFLELCLNHHKISYKRELFLDDKNEEYNKVAEYNIMCS
ncbi:MAG: nitroreductase [Solobacterium sp.]|nr:nitroreductase [Solobacterium sp.]